MRNIFKWLVDYTRKPPAWVAHGDRDIRCAWCQVPKQAHARELHQFVYPWDKKDPRSQ